MTAGQIAQFSVLSKRSYQDWYNSMFKGVLNSHICKSPSSRTVPSMPEYKILWPFQNTKYQFRSYELDLELEGPSSVLMGSRLKSKLLSALQSNFDSIRASYTVLHVLTSLITVEKLLEPRSQIFSWLRMVFNSASFHENI